MSGRSYCAMTGVEILDTGDGIWDDGEWLSWAYMFPPIRYQLEETVRVARCEDLKFEPGAEVSLLLV